MAILKHSSLLYILLAYWSHYGFSNAHTETRTMQYRQHYYQDSNTEQGYGAINKAMMEYREPSNILLKESEERSMIQLSRFNDIQSQDVPHPFLIIRQDINLKPSPFAPRSLNEEQYSNVVSSRHYITGTKLSMAATFLLSVAML